METLQKSTQMFEQAVRLLNEGQRTEADKLRTAARAKRSDSIWLMGKASKFEEESRNVGRSDFISKSALNWNDTVQPTHEKSRNSKKRESVTNRDTHSLRA